MISCENLTCFYGSFLAVDRLTLEIPRGSVCALVGPNGAGKTTTMRMLCTLLRPSRGRATIGGFDVIRELTQVRRLIGYLPEEFRLYEDMTVERYLEFFGRVYSLDAAMRHERATDFLERLGLKDRRKDRIGALSRGMKQRLGVAKSFLHDPEVVFLDEPASGLNPARCRTGGARAGPAARAGSQTAARSACGGSPCGLGNRLGSPDFYSVGSFISPTSSAWRWPGS